MTQVFVSYAHEDAKAAEQLRTQLADTIRHFGLTLWWDAKIQAGQGWNPTIRQAIADSDVFVQLVSSASLASPYITETEAPAIEQAERGRGALVLTVILEKCSWQRRFGARQAMPSDAKRDLRPVRDWRPQRDGWHAVILESEAAIAAWLSKPPDPRFNPAPGPTFGLTPDGFAPVDDPPAAAERIDSQQVNLHGQVKRAADRLDRRITGLQNTHPSVFDEYQDLKTFLGDSVAGTDVAGLWVAKFGLESLHARFSATRAVGTMTEPIEPDLLAGIDKLLGVVEIYGLGFQEWRALNARNREREIVDPVAEAVATRAALDRLAQKNAPFAPSARPILAAASRPLPSPDDPNPAATTPAPEVVAAAAGVGANAIGALARAVVSALREVGTVGSGVWVLSTIAGDPNLEWVRQAAVFLQDHCAPIADFAARHQDIRRLIGGTIDLLTRKPVPRARTVFPDASAVDGSEDTEEGGEFDYEAEARKLILAGEAPPPAWIPHIRHLDLSGTGVTDLSPLSDLKALEELDLEFNGAKDLSPLSGLTALKSLNLGTNGLTDVSPLSGLTALETLALDNTGVTDVTPLSGLTSLETLEISNTGVTDISPLSGLSALATLALFGARVADVSPLSGLTALQTLDLDNTGVTDVSPLSGLTALRTLRLAYTSVTDVSPLSDLTALSELYLNNTGVLDVSPLTGLTTLETFALGNTGVTDVSPLSGLTALREFRLAYTGVTDVSPLSRLTALETLSLGNSGVTNVSPLSGLTALQRLDLENTGVTDVSPLSGLTALETLDLDNTGVTDVSPLSGLTALKTLYLANTGMTDVSSLSGLTALEALILGNTNVTDMSPLSGLTTLETLDLSNSGVMDISPLSGLTALRALYLGNTSVTDVSPLSGLTALERLDLAGTKVTDVSPLARLPVLATLRLARLDLRQSAASLPASVKELDLREAKWPPGRPLPDVPRRIDPDGTVHRSQSVGAVSPWFSGWASEADEFRQSRANPPT
ncbi:leucine-rich repeat domain-containing protein [Prosthecodimorpha staleyi]|uniref:Leucine-rich repeat domain-containing protein n=1 Tax=Prosthecodimorpha staleyi TaxID=2840188 RepID=A0A947CZ24_9HYPH|nr:leucine-rich repeat domain-containing protein [Prosthecodimorpha staleyi]MBT9287925.1 leucine-rich repeat domain-containing protein [Prosthecodimorpha staleyi]